MSNDIISHEVFESILLALRPIYLIQKTPNDKISHEVSNSMSFGIATYMRLSMRFHFSITELNEKLLDPSFDINMKYEKGLTLLHMACFFFDEFIIKTLVENGANVNAKDDYVFFTPLHCFCFAYTGINNLDIAQYLIKNGADVNNKSKEVVLLYILHRFILMQKLFNYF